jgi:hypothetical protein
MAAAAAGTASPIATVESEHELKARAVLQRNAHSRDECRRGLDRQSQPWKIIGASSLRSPILPRIRLYSNPGNDFTRRFPLIVEALERLRSFASY